MTQKTNYNPWTMDVRVRERNLKSGALTDKELEKTLAALPDVSDQAESFGTQQPALVQQHVAPIVSESVVDDEPEDDEDDEEEEEEVAAVAAAPSHEANGAGTISEPVDAGSEGSEAGGGDSGSGSGSGSGSEGEQP
jgi:hypothetical protein